MMAGGAAGDTADAEMTPAAAAATTAAATAADNSSVLREEEEEKQEEDNTHTPPPQRGERGRGRYQPKIGGSEDEPRANHTAVGGFSLGQEENLGGESGDDVVGLGANGGGCGCGGNGIAGVTTNDGGARQHRVVDTQQEEGGSRGGGGGAVGPGNGEEDRDHDHDHDHEGAPIASPRKKQRLRNLRLAKGMERAREKDIAVVGCWIPSVP